MKITNDRSTLAKNPAYLEYPADILNNETFMRMSLPEKGLYWNLRLFCWRNGSIPASAKGIAQLLNQKDSLIYKTLSSDVLSFFSSDDDMSRLYCPDLEAYRQELLEKQKKRSEHGKRAAEKQLNDRRNGNASTREMGSDMNRTDYDPGNGMNGYLTRSLN
jgi:hypothetical protein